jgi:hypothetical protein
MTCKLYTGLREIGCHDDDYLDYCKPFYYVPVKIYFDNIPK